MTITDLRCAHDCLDQLAEWHHRQWSYLNPSENLHQRIERMQAYLGDQLVPSMFVARDGAVLLGSAGIVTHDMDTRTELSPWLASVYVAPEHRRHGIGAALVRHVMTVSAAAGIPTLYLFTPDQERFYQALGWTTMAKETYRGAAVTVMRCDVHP